MVGGLGEILFVHDLSCSCFYLGLLITGSVRLSRRFTNGFVALVGSCSILMLLLCLFSVSDEASM